MSTYVKYSDLEFGVSNQKIILFQPRTSVNEGVHFRATKESMVKAFNDAISLSGLVHVCSLLCNSHQHEPGGPYALGPSCGGSLVLKPTCSIDWLQSHGAHTEVTITCSNPKCGMEVTSHECPDRQSLSNLVLHLMLKQMVPNLPVASYLDCGKKEDRWSMRPGEGEAIRNLGLISLAADALWGLVPNGYFDYNAVQRFAFGFMLAPGMQATDDCSGNNAWLKFLVEKKFESLKEHHRAFASMLLGPKL